MDNERNTLLSLVHQELPQYSFKQIETVVHLLIDEENTVPFIARYRKEMTSSLDEVQIKEIGDTYEQVVAVTERKEHVLKNLEERSLLTPELSARIQQSKTLKELDTLYAPFKMKRKTKAQKAIEQGLLPLAQWLKSLPSHGEVQAEAKKYIDPENEITDENVALQGAHEILSAEIGNDFTFRDQFLAIAWKKAVMTSILKDAEKDERETYKMYYDYSEPVRSIALHRILALYRGEKEEVLRVKIEMPTEEMLSILEKQLISAKKNSPATSFVREAYEDGLKRFLIPSIDREIRSDLGERAEERAIHIFGENLKTLLLQPPLKGKIVLGLDPAYRTGCKLAIVDEMGDILKIAVIYPHKPASEANRSEAGTIFRQLLDEYHVEMIAIGNGTASRESEQFVAEQLNQMDREIYYTIVNEAGASVYSASEVAREEFPDLQVEERSAVSIARRLQDPLAELVKIDPKSVGVGQYQHDVSEKKLTQELDFVVELVVNQVGVNVNTASVELLSFVSGISKRAAKSMVAYRKKNGAFQTREELTNVPWFSQKSYEQAVGFVRILEGENPLDSTSIHPESYPIAEEILALANVEPKLIGTPEANQRISDLSLNELHQKMNVGKETLKDIVDALKTPGRDLRDEMPAPMLRKDVLKIEDLKVGMELQGTVRNVVDFGAFVDIGVKQDGLVHLSKLSNRFVKNANDVVSVGEIVTVWVDEVDLQRGRIALTMIDPEKQ